MKLTLFGAGSIGRSFIAPVFQAGGYSVTFVDINRRIVDELNHRGEYEVIMLAPDGSRKTVTVSGVSGIDARDEAAVMRAVAETDVAATAVGLSAFDTVCEALARGLLARQEAGEPSLDIILAENIPAAAQRAKDVIGRSAPGTMETVGLVETSIGKMVPIMPAEIAERDPLLVYAEPYNTLIVDRRAFTRDVPYVPDIMPVENIRAYVDRKLFIHNLGHATAAYLAHQTDARVVLLSDAMKLPGIREAAGDAMHQSAAGLLAGYPGEFSVEALEDHIEDLLNRFANPALGDTVFRVGRDLRRKLGPNDRIVGAMRLLASHGLPMDKISRAYAAALVFHATDEEGNPFPDDEQLLGVYKKNGLAWLLRDVSGLPADAPHGGGAEHKIIKSITAAVAA